MSQTARPFTVRKQAGRSFDKYVVVRAGRRVSVHAFVTRESAQASADELNVGALVKDYADEVDHSAALADCAPTSRSASRQHPASPSRNHPSQPEGAHVARPAPHRESPA